VGPGEGADSAAGADKAWVRARVMPPVSVPWGSTKIVYVPVVAVVAVMVPPLVPT